MHKCTYERVLRDNYISEYFNAEETPYDVYKNSCYYEKQLLKLLSRIHKDGGQYIKKYGIEKAVNDADIIISALLQMLEEK